MSSVTNNRQLSSTRSVSHGDEEYRVKRARVDDGRSASSLSSSSSSSLSSRSFAGPFQRSAEDEEVQASDAPFSLPPRPAQRHESPLDRDRIYRFISKEIEQKDITAADLPRIRTMISELFEGVGRDSIKCVLYEAYATALVKSLQKKNDPAVMKELLDSLEKHEQFANECRSLTPLLSLSLYLQTIRLQAACFTICHAFPEDFLADFRSSLKKPQDLYRMALEKFHESQAGSSSMSMERDYIDEVEKLINLSSPFPRIRNVAQASNASSSSSSSHIPDTLPPLPPIRTEDSLPLLEGSSSESFDTRSSTALCISEAVIADLNLLFDVCKRLKVEDIHAVKKKISEIAKNLTREEMALVYHTFANALAELYVKDQANVSINVELIECFKQARAFSYATNNKKVIAATAFLTGRLYAFIYCDPMAKRLPEDRVYRDFALKMYEEALQNLNVVHEADPAKEAEIQKIIRVINRRTEYLKNPILHKTDSLISQFQIVSVEGFDELKKKMFSHLRWVSTQRYALFQAYVNALIRLYPTKESRVTEFSHGIEQLERMTEPSDMAAMSMVARLKGDFHRYALDDHDTARFLYLQSRGILQKALVTAKDLQEKNHILNNIQLIDKLLLEIRPVSSSSPVRLSSIVTPLCLSMSLTPVTHYIRGLLAESANPAEALQHYCRAGIGAEAPLKSSIEDAVKRLPFDKIMGMSALSERQ